MRVLVYPHELEMGGSQMNALELAATERSLGHEVIIIATAGVLLEKVRDLSLQFIEAPPRKCGFNPATIHRLTATVRDQKMDLVHAYEWAPIVETAFGPGLLGKVPAVTTVLSMDVPDFLPRHLPLIVGTHRLAEEESRRRGCIHVIEPPIDTVYNKAGASSVTRQQLGIAGGQYVITVVGRLTTDLSKLEGVMAAIRVIDRVAERFPLTLLIAGDGQGLAEVKAAARKVNERHGRLVIRAYGNVVDPRPLYDAADVILGMGSSALRGMSHGKPVIVQGTAGFWRLSCPENQSHFLKDGWFGHGPGGTGDDVLEEVLVRLLNDVRLRSSLGLYNRRLVEERFSLEQAARRLVAIYESALHTRQPSRQRVPSLMRTGYEVAKFRTLMNLRAAGLGRAVGLGG